MGETVRFYHCFYTDLPDQFVEANANRLIKWINDWKGKNRYYQRHMVIDVVGLTVGGNSKKDLYPTIILNSMSLINNWLKTKGHLYNGRYWESLTEDQRNPARISNPSSETQDLTTADWAARTYPVPGTIAYIPARIAGKRISINTIFPQATWRLLNTGLYDAPEHAPNPPLRRDAVIAGEIVGYRCWRIKNNLLRSVYQSDIWRPNQILEGRELGDWDHRGIHAWKDSGSEEYHNYIRSYLNPAEDHFTRMIIFGRDNPTTKPAILTGTVFLWGDVVEHERGYRAEFARVRSLDWLYPDADMMGREQEVLEEFRQRYGVGK